MEGARGSGCDRSCVETGATSSSTAITASTARPCAPCSRYAAHMRLKIRRLDSTVPLPTYGTDEAAGFDLAAASDATIAPRQIALIPTGLVIEVPTGHCLGIFARSSTPLKRGLVIANGVGIVDPDYSGPT